MSLYDDFDGYLEQDYPFGIPGDYGDVCPDPPEHLGCWMEFLRNKYRRPPERQEGTNA